MPWNPLHSRRLPNLILALCRLPFYFFEDPSQFCPADRIDILHPCYAAIKMRAEGRKVRPVFVLRAVLPAIVEDCFQLVIGFARHIEMAVDGKPHDALTAAAPHDSRLWAVQSEAFIFHNGFD